MWLGKVMLPALLLLASIGITSAQNPTPPVGEPWPCSGNSNNATGCQDPTGANCSYFAMWRFDPANDVIQFSIKATVKDGKYLGIGFSSTPNMLNSDVIMAWINSSGQGVISDRYVENVRTVPTEDGTDSSLRDVSVTSSDGLLRVEFKRPRATLDNAIKDFQFNDTNCAHFLFSLNGAASQGFSRHTNRYFTSQKICLSSTCSVEKRGYCPPLQNGMVGTCIEMCSDDFSCTGSQKCCSNGCGHTCQEPVDFIATSCPQGSLPQSSLTGPMMCDRVVDVRCDIVSGYKCNLSSKLCCRESKDMNDVCENGPPKKTTSNMPLTCQKDADCGDQTYWCVPSPRDKNSKVCCPKVQTIGGNTCSLTIEKLQTIALQKCLLTLGGMISATSEEDICRETSLNSTALTCFARESNCNPADVFRFLYGNVDKIFAAFQALIPARLKIILRNFDPNDCMDSAGCMLDSMFLQMMGRPCWAQIQTVKQNISFTEKCRTFSAVVTCINRLCDTSFQMVWNFLLGEAVRNRTLLPFDVQDLRKCSAPDAGENPQNPCMEGIPYVHGGKNHICGNMSKCNVEYMCTDAPKLTNAGGVCCPVARQGQCPAINKDMLPNCPSKRVCIQDTQCELGEKCCQEGCRNKTCVKLVIEEEPVCLKEYRVAANKLAALNSTCMGWTQIWLPRCNEFGWMPQQVIDNLGISFCINTTTGKKIPGSEGRGNINCLTIKPGRCPAPTSNGSNCAITQNICTDDSSCNSAQKCCFNGCFRQCLQPLTVVETSKTDALDIEVCPNGQSPKCCPFDLCIGKTCASNPSAVCRINPCGDTCTVEFFNEKNEKMDCNKSVGTCAVRRQALMNMVNERLTLEERRENFLSLIRPESTVDNNETNNEYNTSVMPGASADMKPYDFKSQTSANICAMFGSYCQNGATCFPQPYLLRLCSCPPAFHGFFCQKNVTSLTYPQSYCLLAKSHMDDIFSALMGNLIIGNRLPMELTRVMNTVIQIAKANIIGKLYLPQTTCSTNGQFNQIQCATNVDDQLKVCYCVNITTSEEDKTKQYASEPGLVNCSKPRIYQDMLPQCLYPKDAGTCTDQQKQWFFNTVNGRCESFIYTGCGGNGNRFNTAFECNIICRSANNPPKPCENLNCTIFQFCAVSFNGTQQKCEDYPDHCQDGLVDGYGDQQIPTYYFDYRTGTCAKFIYKGIGGNMNRFSSYDQCYQECYRYSFGGGEKEGMCPNRMVQSADDCGINTCDIDLHCPSDHKCCSTGCSRTCMPPVVTCNGQRCNIGGYCADNGQCACRDLCTAEYDPVCGSDGKTYSSLCDMEATACRTNEPIYLMTYGNCTIDSSCWTPLTSTSLVTAGSTCMGILAALFSVQQNSTDPFCSVADKALKCLADATGYKVNDYLCLFANKADVEALLNLMSSSMTLTPYAKGQLLDLKGARTKCLGSVCPISNCSDEYSPLCAVDQSGAEITIKNQCELYRQLLCQNKTLRVTYNGTCTGSKSCGGKNCGAGQYCVAYQCLCMVSNCQEYSPVCGVKYSDYSKMTYNSVCHMIRASCLDSVTRFIISKSACEEDEMNNTECPNLTDSMTAAGECDTKIQCPTGLKCCSAGPAKLCVKPVRKQVIKNGICPIITYIQMSPDSVACNAMCMQDGDCSGAAKCCQNNACGHPVCTEPIPLGNNEVPMCGNDSIALSWKNGYYLPCRLNEDCPVPATCKKVNGGFNNQTASICCKAMKDTIDIETIKKKAICNFMPLFGFGCQNGSTCVGDIANGTLCQCKTGTYGVLCDRVGQSSQPATQCQRLNEIGSSIKQKISASDSQLEMFGMIRLESVLSSLDVKLLSYIPDCASDGSFTETQCAMYMGQNFCFCADTKTGEMKEISPYSIRRDNLDCSILSQGYNLRCLQSRDPGPCKGYFPAYFFNSTSKRCEKFIYGGCKGNKNRFSSFADCANTCKPRSRTCGGFTCEQDQVCITSTNMVKKCSTDGLEMQDVMYSCVRLNAAVEDDNMPVFPECTENGTYQFKQCKGSFCWCVNDQGVFVTGSFSRDPTLNCTANGPDSTFVRATCSNGSWPVACPDGGDPCSNCKKYNDDSMTMMSTENCQNQCPTCPRGSQPRACKVDKCSSSCKHFPSAICHINACTCQEEFVDTEGNIVDCNTAQSTCEKYRNEVILKIRQMVADNQQKQQEQDRNGNAMMCQPTNNQGMQQNAELQLLLDDMWLPQCDSRGQFEPMQCNKAGNRCWCVDRQGQTKSGTERKGNVGVSKPSVSCTEEVVKQTRVKWRIDKTFPTTDSKKNKIKDEIKKTLQDVLGWTKEMVDKRVSIELQAGSIIVEVTIQDDTGNLDAVSAGEVISTAANSGEIKFNVDGEEYSPAAGSGTVTEVQAQAPTQKSPSEDVEERNKIIIIVVVVVGGVLIIAIIIFCVCKNRKKENKYKTNENINLETAAHENAGYQK